MIKIDKKHRTILDLVMNFQLYSFKFWVYIKLALSLKMFFSIPYLL